jgi:hypothetical protein
MSDSDHAPAPSEGLPLVQPAMPCRHLRNKGMYVYTDAQDHHGPEDYDNTIYWCLKTMKDFGPDDEAVGGHECRNHERSCFQAI